MDQQTDNMSSDDQHSQSEQDLEISDQSCPEVEDLEENPTKSHSGGISLLQASPESLPS